MQQKEIDDILNIDLTKGYKISSSFIEVAQEKLDNARQSQISPRTLYFSIAATLALVILNGLTIHATWSKSENKSSSAVELMANEYFESDSVSPFNR